MEKRYCQLSAYNRAKVLNEVKKLIAADGGKIVNEREPIEVNIQTADASEKMRAELEAACEPFTFNGGTICFGMSLEWVAGGYYYSISYDDNPFFPMYFCKIKIDENGNYTGRRMLESNEPLNAKQWRIGKPSVLSLGYNDLFGICDDAQIAELASYHYEQIKNVVVGGRESATVAERVRVYNYCSRGYHYERKADATKCNIYK